VLEESLMLYAISHQTETEYSEKNDYRFPPDRRVVTILHAMSNWLGGNASRPNDLLGWFFDFESHLTEIIASGKEPEAYEAFIKALCLLTAFQDPYTARHQKKASELAVGIAREMGLPADMIEGIRVAGFVHDMGKMSVPAEIVTKPSALTPLEFSIMKEHPQKAYAILKQIEFPWSIPEIVLQHHERLDGSGYPQGLKGNEIQMEARVVAVADVVEAISSDRPYRTNLGIEAALEEIDKNKGIFYDTEVTRACLKSFKTSVFMADHRYNTVAAAHL
jgi:putative nucleotidyltransferase with HDIG domain